MIYALHEDVCQGRESVGAKAAGLMMMAGLGIPVPPGCVIAVSGRQVYEQDRPRLIKDLRCAMETLQHRMQLVWNDPDAPLLVSVRSGAAVSMPGMMDSFLNVGISGRTVGAVARRLGDAARADRLYADFVRKWAHHFHKTSLPTDLDSAAMITAFQNQVGHPWQDDPWEHLLQAIDGVWVSWDSPRAVAYRHHHGYSRQGGTAVIIQTMVFGNAAPLGGEFLGERVQIGQSRIAATGDGEVRACEADVPLTSGFTPSDSTRAWTEKIKKSVSGTGVCFTRNPSTGATALFGEYLPDGQGEALVDGRCTPVPLQALADTLPTVYRQLEIIAARLDKHAKDMQDIEFTIERGQLWILQTRSGKRTPAAGLRIAADLVDEGLLDPRQSLCRLDEALFPHVLAPTLVPDHGLPLLAKGLPASPGVAVGRAILHPEDAAPDAIFVADETHCETVPAMMTCAGVVTLRGGMTSHAAVVMRGLGKPCIVALDGAQWIPAAAVPGRISDVMFSGLSSDSGPQFSCAEGLGAALGHDEGSDTHGAHLGDPDKLAPEKQRRLPCVQLPGGCYIQPGDSLTVDASTGQLFRGQGRLAPPAAPTTLQRILGWADDLRTLKIWANADTPQDVHTALTWGAEGIGLCRSEHMIFAPAPLLAMQKVILAPDAARRRAALADLEALHQADLLGLMAAAQGLPLTLRLLDPPLHEFLPASADQKAKIADDLGMDPGTCEQRLAHLREINPMLGHRGCRLAIQDPDIYAMQVRACAKAMQDFYEQTGQRAQLALLIPFVVDAQEVAWIRDVIQDTWRHTVQTMVHGPRCEIFSRIPPALSECMTKSSMQKDTWHSKEKSSAQDPSVSPDAKDEIQRLRNGNDGIPSGTILAEHNLWQYKHRGTQGRESDKEHTTSNEVPPSDCAACACAVMPPLGIMIETPRAALLASQMAVGMDFVSFGTNDLTQMTWALSRDDYGSFFPSYQAQGFQDPFLRLDQQGVGVLIAQACASLKHNHPALKISVCGEHAGDPASIAFFHRIGVTHLSCSPMRLPCARLAAGRAAGMEPPLAYA